MEQTTDDRTLELSGSLDVRCIAELRTSVYALLDECDRVGEQMLLQRRLHSPESVSRELFTSAIDLKDNLGLLAPEEGESPEDLQRRRTEHLEFVTSLIDRAQLIESLDAANRAEVTGVAV